MATDTRPGPQAKYSKHVSDFMGVGELAKLRAERAELVAALRDMMNRYGPDNRTLQSTPWDRARALLAKLDAKGAE